MFIHSWRWFGPDDPVTLDQIVQTGATHIVTALHRVPAGETWLPEEIRTRKELIQSSGLQWGVVESVPVHEEIKKRSGHYRDRIENYKQSLKNLGREKIGTVCYNFMPALDWSRTNLKNRGRDGSEASSFDFTLFAAMDIHLLKRPGASESYPPEILEKAEALIREMTAARRKELLDTFLLGFPGSGETFSLKAVLERIEGYAGLGRDGYISNLKEFLKEIVPVAESEGVLLALHPDDPPFPLLGLPRAVSNLRDALEIISAVDSHSNGLTFCTGSFGASSTNDLPRMARELAGRINFLHIRNVIRDDRFNFQECNLLEGDVDVYAIMKTMILEDLHRVKSRPGYEGIPVRPDHGARILDDHNKIYYPGYPLYGRMKNLAEIRGLEAGIRNCLSH